MEPKRKPKKKIAAIIIVAAAALLITGYITTVYAGNPEEEESLLREYPVTRGNITAGIDGSGVLSIDGTPQNFDAPRVLEEVYVKQGDQVKKGDQLAKLSIDSLSQKRDQLQYDLEKAEIALEDAKNGKRMTAAEMQNAQSPEEAGNAEYQQQRASTQSTADGLQAKANDLNAQIAQLNNTVNTFNAQIAELEGQIALLPADDPQKAQLVAQRDGFVVERDKLPPQIAELEGQLNTTQGELSAANQNVQALDSARAQTIEQNKKERAQQNQVNGIKLENGENAIELAQMEIDNINRQIADIDRQIKDPYLYAAMDGIILEVNYAAGMETTADKPVASIGDLQDIYVALQVSQADIGDIEEGQVVELAFDAFPDRTFTGTVTKKLPTPIKDSNPVSYLVYASLDTEGEALLPGMTCGAQFIRKQVEDVLQLSNKAIKLADDGRQIVLMQDQDGELYEQPITTGFSDGRYSEILSGLSEGDIVYVEG